MKKRVSLLLTVALLLTSVAGTSMLASASTGVGKVEQDGVTVDGSLDEWADAVKNPLSVYNGEGFDVTEDEYCQFIYSPDSLYFSMVVKDSTNTKDELVRDHLRLSVLLPDGSIGLFYSDNDGWNNATDCPGWWGYTGTNAIGAASSTAVFTYNSDDGTLTVEGRACFTEEARSQLADGAQLKVALQYFDYMACNATNYSGTKWASFGSETVTAIAAQDITGEMTLGETDATGDDTETENPDQEVFNYEAVAEKGGSETDIDGDFWEWDNAKTYALDVYDPDTGLFTKSEDEYVQFIYTYGQLYFSIYAKDEGQTIDNLIRDHVRFTVFFPDGSEAFYYYDCDDWYEAGAGAWFGLAETDVEAEAMNAALRDNSNSRFVYDDNGYVRIEGRINVRDTLKDVFVNGTELKVAIEYFDGQLCNGTEYDGSRWLKWGTTVLCAVNEEDVTGTVTLHDPEYQDTTDMEVQEATAGAINGDYAFNTDGSMTITVEPFEGAASYRVNVFDRWEGVDGYTYVANHYVESDTSTLVVTDLTDGGDYGYQVIALDADGNTVAVYPVVAFTAGGNNTDPAGPSETPGTNEPSDNTPSDDEQSDNGEIPQTGGVLPTAALTLLAVSTAAVVLLKRKQQ